MQLGVCSLLYVRAPLPPDSWSELCGVKPDFCRSSMITTRRTSPVTASEKSLASVPWKSVHTSIRETVPELGGADLFSRAVSAWRLFRCLCASTPSLSSALLPRAQDIRPDHGSSLRLRATAMEENLYVEWELRRCDKQLRIGCQA